MEFRFFGKPQYGSSAADLSLLLLASATVRHMYVYIELLEAPFAREMGIAGDGGPNKAPYQASHCLEGPPTGRTPPKPQSLDRKPLSHKTRTDEQQVPKPAHGDVM